MSGIQRIAAERHRQMLQEGWTPEHDDEHANDDIATAAACYALPARERRPGGGEPPAFWPWERDGWKPSPGNRIRELEKAGALIAAEIDRLERAQPQREEDRNEKKPRLMYYEEAEECWTLADADGAFPAVDFEGMSSGDEIEIRYKRVDMSDAELENLPEV